MNDIFVFAKNSDSSSAVRRGIGGHQSPINDTDIWLTPPEIIADLGPFDLDPCSPIDRPWPTASHHFTKLDDGLSQSWMIGDQKPFVFMNPPYGSPSIVRPWMDRIAAHNHGIALIFARTETEMFFATVWRAASAVLFIEGRLFFHRPDGTRADNNAGAPSVLCAYGEEASRRLQRSTIKGKFLNLAVCNDSR